MKPFCSDFPPSTTFTVYWCSIADLLVTGNSSDQVHEDLLRMLFDNYASRMVEIMVWSPCCDLFSRRFPRVLSVDEHLG